MLVHSVINTKLLKIQAFFFFFLLSLKRHAYFTLSTSEATFQVLHSYNVGQGREF